MSETFLVTPNSTSPGIVITPTSTPSKPTNVSFSIFVQTIREIDQDGTEVGMVNVTDLTFSLFHTPPTNTSNNEMWEFFATLENQATVSITVSKPTQFDLGTLGLLIYF
jgi:hypothetical protein